MSKFMSHNLWVINYNQTHCQPLVWINDSAFGYQAIVDQIENGAEDVVLYKRNHHMAQLPNIKIQQYKSALEWLLSPFFLISLKTGEHGLKMLAFENK